MTKSTLHHIPRTLQCRQLLVLAATLAAIQVQALAQGPPGAPGRGGPAQPAVPPLVRPPRPVDLTGYWVSVVTTADWRLRMVPPPKGDFAAVRMTPAAIKLASAWDPAKDEAAGEQCKAYGAAGIMHIPGRLHITQKDEKTLQVDLDAGTQTRLFHLGDWKAPAGEATLQGESLAQWDTSGTGGLKVVTNRMKPGYLRRNGAPYSGNAVLTEYFDLVRQSAGDQWLILTTVLEDPANLVQPYTDSIQFRKQANGAGWDPTPCSAKW